MVPAVEGVQQLQKQLREIARLSSPEDLLRAAAEAAEPIAAKARSLIPVGVDKHRTYKGREVQPGFAKANVRVKATLSKDKKTASAAVGVQPEAFYAVQFVELGTSKMAAQPWLRPAYAATRQQQQSILAKNIRTLIEVPVRRRK